MVFAQSHHRKKHNIKRLGVVNVTNHRKGIIDYFNKVADGLEGKKLKILEIGAAGQNLIPVIFEGHDITRTEKVETGNMKELDLEKVPKKEYQGKFDIVICSEVLEHIFDIRKAVRNLSKLVKKGGYTLITTPFSYHVHIEPRKKFLDYHRPTKYFLETLLKDYFKKVEVTPELVEGFVDELPCGYCTKAYK